MKRIVIIISSMFLFNAFALQAQNVGIGTNTPDASAKLEIQSTASGILIPRMTTTQRNMISNPATGLLVFDNTTGTFWFYSGTSWDELVTDAKPGDKIADMDGDTKIQVEEGADEDIIRFDLAGTERWKMTGTRLEPMNSGQSVFIGEQTGANDDLNNNESVFIGYQSGKTNIWGFGNTANGNRAFYSNISGFQNTASGYEALYSNIDGFYNSAIGLHALYSNTTGSWNTASGYFALRNNTTGNSNTASGREALRFNTTGDNNTASGYQALLSNTTGSNNTALGYGADVTDDSLTNATAIGYNAKVATSNSLVLGGTGADAVNVGIGTTSPDTTLHVIGNIKMEDGTEGAGKVMISDSNGVASWTSQSTLSPIILVDADNDTKIQVDLGGADDDIIHFDMAGTEFFRMDSGRLEVVNTGGFVFIGEGAGANDDLSNNENVFVGYQAGNANTTGTRNTAIGRSALFTNTTGNYNTAIGNFADVTLDSLTYATAIGYGAKVATSSSLVLGGTGVGAVNVGIGTNSPGAVLEVVGHIWQTGTGTSVFIGEGAGANDDLSDNRNVFVGYQAGNADTTGTRNIGIGWRALYSQTTGSFNTASGFKALYSNTTGLQNSALGYLTLFTNTTGNNNTALGSLADVTIDGLTNATTIGANAKVATSNSLVLGGTGGSAVNVGIGTTSPDTTLHVMGSIKMEDGTEAAGKVMISDSNGVASWTSQSTLKPIMLNDADNDTKIQVDAGGADEDIIRFDMAGTEFFRMDSARFEVLNSGQSVFIGEGAGANDDLTDSKNVFVGYEAGNLNTIGTFNTASGYRALSSIGGKFAIAIGLSQPH